MFAWPVRSLKLLAILLLSLLSSSTSEPGDPCSQQQHESASVRFASQLTIDGCAVFVHSATYCDRASGRPPGTHLLVEPLMCVRSGVQDWRSNSTAPVLEYDGITEQAFLRVLISLRDDAILPEVLARLSHLTPVTANFAAISEVRAEFAGSTSEYTLLNFVRSSDDATGVLWLGCKPTAGLKCSINALWSRMHAGDFSVLDNVTLSATLLFNGVRKMLNYQPVVNDAESFLSLDLLSQRSLPVCHQLEQIRLVRIRNCTTPVHKRLDRRGHLLVEPLLCYSGASVRFDYFANASHLELDVILHDRAAQAELREQLVDLMPLSIDFMRLTHAQVVVSPALGQRFAIGPLMVSRDGMSARVRVHCRNEIQCRLLRSQIVSEPAKFWQHLRWATTLSTDATTGAGSRDSCQFESRSSRTAYTIRIAALSHIAKQLFSVDVFDSPYRIVQSVKLPLLAQPCWMTVGTISTRRFVVIQQRLKGSVSFEQSWSQYESGFGDDSDFWIGLAAIHQLTSQQPDGANLRVEMKLVNGAQLHAEYAGFRVAGASANYRMTYREMLRSKSSDALQQFDALAHSKGMGFSAKDNGAKRSCSTSSSGDNSGWWFNFCQRCNPNGMFSHPQCGTAHGIHTCMYWRSSEADYGWLAVANIRLLVEYQQSSL